VDPLLKIYEQNTWANLRLIDACDGLADMQLDAIDESGFYGSIRETLQHIIAAEERYAFRLSGEEPPDGFLKESQPFPGFEELKARARTNGDRFELLVPKVSPVDKFNTEFDGKKYEIDKYIVVVQAINHGTEHRAQIKTLMTQLGVQPPELDGWTFAEASGAMRKAT
jgi:uncharacterized damage-inducible protein DinB